MDPLIYYIYDVMMSILYSHIDLHRHLCCRHFHISCNKIFYTKIIATAISCSAAKCLHLRYCCCYCLSMFCVTIQINRYVLLPCASLMRPSYVLTRIIWVSRICPLSCCFLRRCALGCCVLSCCALSWSPLGLWHLFIGLFKRYL